MSIFGDSLRKLTSLIQTKQGSFLRHNKHFTRPDVLELERQGAAENERSGLWDKPEFRIDELLAKHPEVRTLAVDIGSGAGWFSSKLSKLFTRVIGIEASAAGLEIAKRLYPENSYPNISWVQGFAEDVLPTLDLSQPAFFLTGVVLSHLRDKEVMRICEVLNTKAAQGSILCFSECWGEEWHQQMWHVRTKEWWQQQLSNWELDFHGPEIQNTPDRHKGIHGLKVK